MTNALTDRLVFFAGHLIVSGRMRADAVSTAPLEAVLSHVDGLDDIEHALADFYLHLQPDDDLPTDEAPLDLSKHAAEGESTSSVARRWAELACRGHYFEDPLLLNPLLPWDPGGEYEAVLAAAGVDVGR